jgi:phage gp29-like protein
MRLVDQFGNPITSDALTEPQTEARASLVHLRREIAGHPSRGITPARLNDILMQAEQGDLVAQHELFADMEERDAHVYTELAKRKRASIKLDWDIVPPRNASKEEEDQAAWVREQMQDMADLEDTLFDALDAISHGFSAQELEWELVERTWTVKKFNHRPQSWFQLDHDTRTKLRLRDFSANGAELQPFGWLLHTHKAISGYVSRSGLGRVLVWPYLFKHFSVGDLAEFLDIHGLPIIVGKYPSNASQDEKSTLFRAVAGIGHNARGIIPSGMELEIQQAADSKGDPFLNMIAWCERSQSKAINGSTLTSEGGSTGLGSGLAEVHNEVRMDIRDSDCKQLAGTITRDLVYPLLAVNRGLRDARRCPRFVLDTSEAEDLKLYADSLPKLIAVGMRIKPEWAHEKLRIPMAEEKDEVLKSAPAPAAPDPNAPPAPPAPAVPPEKAPGAKARAKLTAELIATLGALKAGAEGQAGDDELSGPQPDLSGPKAIDAALAQLNAADLDWQAAGLLEPVVKAIMSADSFEGMQAALDAAIEQQDVGALATALHRVGFAAHWLGAGELG